MIRFKDAKRPGAKLHYYHARTRHNVLLFYAVCLSILGSSLTLTISPNVIVSAAMIFHTCEINAAVLKRRWVFVSVTMPPCDLMKSRRLDHTFGKRFIGTPGVTLLNEIGLAVLNKAKSIFELYIHRQSSGMNYL
jgi:hypothetical protein